MERLLEEQIVEGEIGLVMTTRRGKLLRCKYYKLLWE